MLDALDAQRAHARCKARLADRLCDPQPGSDLREFGPDPDCAISRFICDGEKTLGCSPEVCLLKAAHTTVHSVAIGLAQRRAMGQVIDVDFEFGTHSNLGAASSSLISAVWRLEKKLHALVG
jgi:hypothetical protein